MTTLREKYIEISDKYYNGKNIPYPEVKGIIRKWLTEKRQLWKDYSSTTNYIEGYKDSIDELLAELTEEQTTK